MTATQAVAGQRITAAFLNTNIPGAWQAITPQNSWVNLGGSAATFQARLFNSVLVEVIGTLKNGTITGGTTIGTLPAGMLPVSTQQVNGDVFNPSGVAGESFGIAISAAGVMAIWGVPSTTTQISFHFFVSLDA